MSGHTCKWREVPAQKAGGRVYGPYRLCEECWTGTTLATSPPAGHPDRDPIYLTAVELAVLAHLDAELSGGR